MLMLIIGLILTCLMTYCIFIAIPMSGANKTDVMISFIILLVTGIYLIIKGINKAIMNSSISKNGKKCYAMIKNIYQIDDSNLFNIEVAIYIEDDNSVEYTSFDSMKHYKKGDFLIVKYYNREVNVLGQVFVNAIPIEIQKKFFTNETLKTTDRVTNYEIKPMDMPENGTAYAWQDNDKTIK